MQANRMAVLALVGLIAAAFSGCVGKPPESRLDVVQVVFDTLSMHCLAMHFLN